MKRALVTLVIGRFPEAALSLPLMERYAGRHNLELIVLRDRRIRRGPWWRKARLLFEKFQMADVLATHERALFLDADILLTPGCPDLLELVPPGHIGAVRDDTGPGAWKRSEEMARAQKRLGPLNDWDGRFFNSGVLALSAEHRPLFDPARRMPAGRWPEQTGLNYWSARLGIPRYFLPPEANFTAEFPGWHAPSQRHAAWAIHYAGQENRALLRIDAPAITKAWNDLP